jgi:hypothetical protein
MKRGHPGRVTTFTIWHVEDLLQRMIILFQHVVMCTGNLLLPMESAIRVEASGARQERINPTAVEAHMKKMDRLLEELLGHHYPEPPATLDEISEFERRIGWRLDPDLRTFYLHCNGARLFKAIDTPYHFLPLSEIVRGRVTIYGMDDDDDDHGPASWYNICDVHDGNCIVIDVNEQQEGYYPVIDGFHEAYGDPVECKQIANRFADFLEGALASGGRQFWLG